MQPVLSQPAEAYRRCARRIRGRHGDKPGELYRSLRDLSDQYDSKYPVTSDRRLSMRETTPADQFTAQILGRIRGGVLTYSDRLELLDEAGKLGIGRFDANLIIAAVQHRYSARGAVEIPRITRKVRMADVVGTVLVVQALILFLAWAVFIH